MVGDQWDCLGIPAVVTQIWFGDAGTDARLARGVGGGPRGACAGKRVGAGYGTETEVSGLNPQDCDQNAHMHTYKTSLTLKPAERQFLIQRDEPVSDKAMMSPAIWCVKVSSLSQRSLSQP